MKKSIILFLSFIFIAGIANAQETKSADINKIFYDANSLYEKGDYTKAVEKYLEILDQDAASGNIYYNIGNGFFKLNKIGYAILCYEKARRFMPRDGDLRANLQYAVSLTDEVSYEESFAKRLAHVMKIPYRDLNLNGVALVTGIFYVVMILLTAVSIVNRIFARRYSILLLAAIGGFIFSLTVFGIRYYEDMVLEQGIVVAKDAECKYEPIDKSTTYYKVSEGNNVIILKTRNGWRQIKRADGKIGWVVKGAVEKI